MAAHKNNRYAAKYDKGEMEKICESLLDWAENSRSIHFANFSRKVIKKSTKWLLATAEHYPQLREAIDEAKEIISGKLVDSCVYVDDPKFNPTAAQNFLPLYSKEWKEHLKWKAEISKEQPTKEEHKAIFNEAIKQLKE